MNQEMMHRDHSLPAEKRIFGLDILRCYSILMVIWIHAVPGLFPPEMGSWMMRIVNTDPVGIFFILSGFLIGRIFLRKIEDGTLDQYGLLEFLIKRFLRILPLYFFMLIVCITLSALIYDYFNTEATWPYFLFIQNLRSYDIYFFPESWSLAVEVWFYITSACSVMLLNRILPSINAVLLVGLIMIAAGILIRLYKYQAHAPATIADFDTSFKLIVTCAIDYPAYGLIGAYLHRKYRAGWEKHKRLFLFCSLALLFSGSSIISWSAGPDFPTSFFWCVFSNTYLSLLVLLWLPLLTGIHSGKGIICNAVTYISQRSYSLYLVHFTLIITLVLNSLVREKLLAMQDEQGLWSSIIFFAVFLVIVFPVAEITYRYIELPFMQMHKQKFRQLSPICNVTEKNDNL